MKNKIFINGFLRIKEKQLEEGINYVIENKYKKIILSLESEVTDLSFLYKMPFLTHLDIFATYVNKKLDLEPLYSLESLEWISIAPPKLPIDFSRLKKLDFIGTGITEKITLKGSRVRDIYLQPLTHVEMIPALTHLKKMKILGYKAENIKSISKLENLEELTIVNARNLVTLEGIEHLKHLNTLCLESINKEVDVSILEKCKNVENLYIYDTITDCKFVKKMKSLQVLSCKEIANGDLQQPLFQSNITDLNLHIHKRNYNYTRKQLIERFGEY